MWRHPTMLACWPTCMHLSLGSGSHAVWQPAQGLLLVLGAARTAGMSTTSSLLSGLAAGRGSAISTGPEVSQSSSLQAHLGNVAGNVAVALLDAPGHIQRHVWGDSLPTLPADFVVCDLHLGGVMHHARQCPTICISQAGCPGRAAWGMQACSGQRATRHFAAPAKLRTAAALSCSSHRQADAMTCQHQHIQERCCQLQPWPVRVLLAQSCC